PETASQLTDLRRPGNGVCEVRYNFDNNAWHRSSKPFELRVLADTAVAVPVRWNVRQSDLPVTRPGAHQPISPNLLAVGVLKAQLAQRYAHLNYVSVAADFSGRFPGRVPGRIVVTVYVIEGPVELHAERVGEELERAAAVIIGIETDADIVVRVEGVTVAQPCPNARRVRIVRHDPDIHAIAIFQQPGNGLDRGCRVLTGVGFIAEFDLQRVCPSMVIEHSVDPDVGFYMRQRGRCCNNRRRNREKQKSSNITKQHLYTQILSDQTKRKHSLHLI